MGHNLTLVQDVPAGSTENDSSAPELLRVTLVSHLEGDSTLASLGLLTPKSAALSTCKPRPHSTQSFADSPQPLQWTKGLTGMTPRASGPKLLLLALCFTLL